VSPAVAGTQALATKSPSEELGQVAGLRDHDDPIGLAIGCLYLRDQALAALAPVHDLRAADSQLAIGKVGGDGRKPWIETLGATGKGEDCKPDHDH
jgi:hypothetical protein